MATTQNRGLFDAALKADDLFHAAVVKQFGAENAGTMRYLTTLHNDETRTAFAAKIAADEAFRQSRSDQ
jgi:hypothetical protein